MSILFGTPDKIGCFTAKTLNTAGSRGVVVRLPTGGSLPSENLSDPYLVQDLAFTLEEMVQFNKLFGDRTTAYSFGHNPMTSSAAVTLVGFYGERDVISRTYQLYKDNRLYAQPQRAAISAGGSNMPIEGHIVGITSNTQRVDTDIQIFTLKIAIPDLGE